MNRLGMGVAIWALAAGIAHAAGPAPQFSVEQLQRQFASPTPSGEPAAGGCEAQGLATGTDGSCEPRLGDTRGFSLPRLKGQAPGPSARSAAPPRSVRAQARSSRRVPPPAPRGFDLLITFENNSSVLTEQAKANAGVFAQAVSTPALQGAHFALDGHTNAVGSRASNLALSRQRANALADFLGSRGVDPTRLEVNGFGFDRPLDPAHPKAAINRRVEVRRLS